MSLCPHLLSGGPSGQQEVLQKLFSDPVGSVCFLQLHRDNDGDDDDEDEDEEEEGAADG